jgi:quinol monooxygenase YgiN
VSDTELLVVADVHGLAGRAGELRSLLNELAHRSRHEAQCASFRVLAEEDAGEFVLLATWRDEGALRAHYDTPHYRYHRDHVGPLLARPSDVVVHHLSSTLHARDPNPPDPGLLG